MDDQDYSQLPLEDKLVHKVWKVRLEAYTTLCEQFTNLRNPQDEVFAIINSKPDLVKNMVTDANVVAQETAIQALVNYLQFCGNPSTVSRLKNAGVLSAICEKGLASSRAGTKAKSVDALLYFVEILDSGDQVVEAIVPYLDHRLPKLVASCVNALFQIVEQFGCGVAPPKSVIPKLPKLFAHADRTVRAETTKLTVEIYRWMGDGLTTVLFADLKPIQQRDLTAEFEKILGKPEQIRLTRSQQVLHEENGDNDVEMVDAEPEVAQFDPFDMLEPVDVISKLPADLHFRMSSAKWKDRKEALEDVDAVLSKAPKLAHADYSDLVRLLAKCMKDANIQVVQLAASAIEYLSKGLKDGFHKYQNLVVGPMIERTKEKKPSVADALAAALDSIFTYSGLLDVLEETLNGMRHKTPQIKISATNYLQRCLANTTVPPKTAQIDTIMETAVKLLTDSLEPIRQAATEMVGTLMKITGEREIKPFLDKIDDNRNAKVKAVFESAVVKCSSAKPRLESRTDARPPAVGPGKQMDSRIAARPTASATRPNGVKKVPVSIPSKRSATSPAKRVEKVPPRTFTGRLLISPATQVPDLPPLSNAADKEEIDRLKRENARLAMQNEQQAQANSELANEQLLLKQRVEQLRADYDQSQKDYTNVSLLVKQRDTQILRLNSDLESAKLKIRSLEQTVEMMKLQQNTQKDPLLTFDKRSPEKIPRFLELNKGVDRLSIGETVTADEMPKSMTDDVSKVSDSTNVFHTTKEVSEEENWRKAAEVTAQLKARIEKMKQRNRLALNRS